jgi:hypothetical protein
MTHKRLFRTDKTNLIVDAKTCSLWYLKKLKRSFEILLMTYQLIFNCPCILISMIFLNIKQIMKGTATYVKKIATNLWDVILIMKKYFCCWLSNLLQLGCHIFQSFQVADDSWQTQTHLNATQNKESFIFDKKNYHFSSNKNDDDN